MVTASDVLSRFISAFILAMVLTGCTGVPKGIEPVRNFQLQPWLGTWYEIARLDHRFEKGLSQVSATYRPRDDGGIEVINRGWLAKEQQWKEVTGKGYFQQDTETGLLKVSFFGPFYGSYVIFELGEDYDYAFVTGQSRNYLWLLARTPTVSAELRERFEQTARTLGFPTRELIWVEQRPEAE